MRFEIMDNDLLSVQEARILAENARDAQAQMAAFSQSRLDAIVAQLADAVRPHVKELALMSADETDYGNWQDKLVKNRFVTETLPRQLASMKCVGITHRDEERKLYDIGVPLGVLVSLTPATSPVSTTIYNALIAIKSGNLVFAASACGANERPRARHSHPGCSVGWSAGGRARLSAHSDESRHARTYEPSGDGARDDHRRARDGQ